MYQVEVSWKNSFVCVGKIHPPNFAVIFQKFIVSKIRYISQCSFVHARVTSSGILKRLQIVKRREGNVRLFFKN